MAEKKENRYVCDNVQLMKSGTLLKMAHLLQTI